MPNVDDIITADAKSISDILGEKYSIGVFQREYNWERKQIEELLSDLESKFEPAYDKEHGERKKLQNTRRIIWDLSSLVTKTNSQ